MISDLKFALRMLAKKPGFTCIAILTLALGIGANTAMFSVVNSILLRPLHFAHPEALVQVWGVQPELERAPISPAAFLDWKQQNEVFERIAAYVGKGFNVRGDKPERLIGARVSGDIFKLLGVQPKIGRSFSDGEDEAGKNRVVIISDAIWKTRFGRDPKIIGQTLTLDGQPHSIVGVMPADFVFPESRTQLWTPIGFTDQEKATRDTNYLSVVARLKSGTNVAQANAAMEALARRLAQRDAAPDRSRVKLLGLGEAAMGTVRPMLYVLLGAVGFVLLIACANVANLLLARTAERGKEIAIRVALGASRRDILQLLLAESVFLALIGGTLGLLLAFWGIDFLVALKPFNLPRLSEVSIDWATLAFTGVVSLCAGVGFGVLPGLAAVKTKSNEALKQGGRSGAALGARSRVRNILIVSEVALSLVLLIGAGLMIRSFARLLAVEPGFRPDHVFTATISLPLSRYESVGQQDRFFQDLTRRIEALPGVEAAAVVTDLPLYGGSSTGFDVEGLARPENSHRPLVEYRIASPNYFRALGASLVLGRSFTERDNTDAPAVVVINKTLAPQFFAGTNPIGKRIGLSGPTDWREIVGVVKDLRNYGLDEDVRPEAYIPSLQNVPGYLAGVSSAMTLVVRTRGEPLSYGGAIQTQLYAIDKDQPMSNVMTLEQYFGDSLLQRRFNMLLLGAFAALALILAAIGIYGVVSYSVAQRTQEVGIRMALGADRAAIFSLVIRQVMSVAAVGLLIGIAAALGLTRLLSTLLYHVSATDPLVFISLTALLALVALLAGLVPARRATRVDPLRSLRFE